MAEEKEDDKEQLVDNEEVDIQIQPHLQAADPLEYFNKTLEVTSTSSHAVRGEGNTDGEVRIDDVDSNKNDVKSMVTPMGSHPVYYSSQNGVAAVVDRAMVVTMSDGSQVIQTQQCCHNVPQRWRDQARDRPLRLKHIQLMKIFAIIAIVLFFPTGIPALVYALKTETEFHDGITKGNLDNAKKCARKTERCIILSGFLAIIMIVIILAIIERSVASDYQNNHRIMPH